MSKPVESRTVAAIRALLDRLVASERESNDDREDSTDAVIDEFRALPREGLLTALERAVGSSKRRRRASIYLLGELTDVPDAVERIRELLNDPDPRSRATLVQIVAHAGLVQVAPALNDLIEGDPDPIARRMAIAAAGRLRQQVNLPTLLRVAAKNERSWVWPLTDALKMYATEECRPYLQARFDDLAEEKGTRIHAAWGLGKLGDRKAIAYLITMLHDPATRTVMAGSTRFDPGESLRAAQALCDIHGWPFEWHKKSVDATITRIGLPCE